MGADAVAHGATGKGNDQVRFELAYYALLAPGSKSSLPGGIGSCIRCSDLIAYAHDFGIPVTATVAKPYSTDRNLMHVSSEGGSWRIPGASRRRTCIR